MGARSGVVLGIASVALAVVMGIVLKDLTRTGHPDTVIVPGIRSANLLFAFDQLRGSGLRVAIPSTIPFRETSSPMVKGQSPPGGARVDWGSVVTLSVWGGFIGSPSGPEKLPVYRVPDFAGRPLTDAVAWTEGKTVFWTSDLPALPPSSAKHLFDAYVITSQHPRAGSDVKLWDRVPNGVRLTPLVLEVAVR